MSVIALLNQKAGVESPHFADRCTISPILMFASPRLKGLFVVVLVIATFGLAAAQTEPQKTTESGQSSVPGQGSLVPYKDVGWRAPSSGEAILANIKSESPSIMGLIIVSRVTKGSTLASAVNVYVINPDDRLPGCGSSLEAGRFAIESSSGSNSTVKITALDEKGFVAVFGVPSQLILPVGTEFEIEKMRLQDTEFDKGIIALRANGLEWRSRPESTAPATQPAEPTATQPAVAPAASTGTPTQTNGVIAPGACFIQK